MGVLLTADLHDRVRRALDTSLDADSLPDEVIDNDLYALAAEAEVVFRDPLATTYAVDTDQRNRSEHAVAFITAARLAPALPQLLSETLGDWKYQLAEKDLTKLAARLRGLAERELARNLSPNGYPETLPSFWLAAGRRGR